MQVCLKVTSWENKWLQHYGGFENRAYQRLSRHGTRNVITDQGKRGDLNSIQVCIEAASRELPRHAYTIYIVMWTELVLIGYFYQKLIFAHCAFAPFWFFNILKKRAWNRGWWNRMLNSGGFSNHGGHEFVEVSVY